MRLLLDIGNTTIAWALKEKDIFQSSGRFFYQHVSIIDDVNKHLGNLDAPEQVLISSVIREENLIQWIKLQWQCDVWQAKTSSVFAELKNSYPKPEQMGIDRWLAMISAWNEFKTELCVIDCGTAMTIDLIDTNGQHKGGYILPGLQMMQSQINQGTDRISVDVASTGQLFPANNTKTAINHGAILGMVASVEYVHRHLMNNMGSNRQSIITGGDAPEIIKHSDIKMIYRPLLVLEGLSILGDKAS